MNENEHVQNGIPRRVVLDSAGAVATALAAAPNAALAEVRGANAGLPRRFETINKYLKDRDYEVFEKLEDGYTPLMLIAGAKPPANVDGVKVLTRNFDGTMLVRYPYPSNWVVSEPKIDPNAESGTIVAADSGKGSSCIFVSERLPEGVTSFDKVSDKTLGNFLTNLIKDDVGEIKITKRKINKMPDGEEYLTFASQISVFRGGNELQKQGYGAAFIKGNSIVGNTITYLPKRKEKVGPQAKYMAENTRVYKIPTPKNFIDDDEAAGY
jgi:hypothetical protein